jgi:hypothetical protein
VVFRKNLASCDMLTLMHMMALGLGLRIFPVIWWDDPGSVDASLGLIDAYIG